MALTDHAHTIGKFSLSYLYQPIESHVASVLQKVDQTSIYTLVHFAFLVVSFENAMKRLGIHVGVNLKTTSIAVGPLFLSWNPLFIEVVKEFVALRTSLKSA